MVTRATADEETLPDINDFSIAVLQNNNVQLTWNRYADFTDGTEIAAGNYTLKATYGNIETQGFEAPYYEGAKEFSIKKNESTNISVICYLANVKVTTEYTELFKKYFTDYTVNIRPAGSTDISFDKNETRAAYVKPGKISIYLSGSKQQGNKVTFEAATIENAKARQHYRLKFDVHKARGETRATVSMERAARLEGPLVLAIGNAPTALVRACELIDAGELKPALVIGVPVGFVNVVESKELLLTLDVPYIVARGRKGGSNVAAAICNAMLYQASNNARE